jgi:hypothetical protein
MMSGMPLETCWAFNKRWNNKFYYKIASCWLFLLIRSFTLLSLKAPSINKTACNPRVWWLLNNGFKNRRANQSCDSLKLYSVIVMEELRRNTYIGHDSLCVAEIWRRVFRIVKHECLSPWLWCINRCMIMIITVIVFIIIIITINIIYYQCVALILIIQWVLYFKPHTTLRINGLYLYYKIIF